MNTELTYSTPEDEGVSSEYIINFLNEMEKREAEIHGIMIARHGKTIKLYLKHITNRTGKKSRILYILLQNVLQIQRQESLIQKDL